MFPDIRFIVGIIGSVACMLLYSAPILTFKRVIKKASVEEFSCIPYILALFSCLTYSWYGFPVVSYGWENMTVCSISSLGVLFEGTFISIYVWFAPRGKKKASHADGISDSSSLLHDCVFLKLFNTQPSYT
jgi:solute carrier family 50 protein (sugar transporter)